MRKFLMKPPKLIRRILERFPAYREWYVKQVAKMLKEDAMKGLLT